MVYGTLTTNIVLFNNMYACLEVNHKVKNKEIEICFEDEFSYLLIKMKNRFEIIFISFVIEV